MRRAFVPAAVVVVFAACVSADHLAPTFDQAGELGTLSLPAVRFSELHYDNTGTDAGEAIEVSGPAGTDVTGWRIVLYNGTGGAAYHTDTLRTTIPATCGDRGVVVVNYPSNGIQNGSPDGLALVDGAGAVVEFLSYEGTFTAVGGPANGMASVDIVASEAGTEPLGESLQRNGADVWSGPSANTFGACNDNDVPPPPPPPQGLERGAVQRQRRRHVRHAGVERHDCRSVRRPRHRGRSGARSPGRRSGRAGAGQRHGGGRVPLVRRRLRRDERAGKRDEFDRHRRRGERRGQRELAAERRCRLVRADDVEFWRVQCAAREQDQFHRPLSRRRAAPGWV